MTHSSQFRRPVRIGNLMALLAASAIPASMPVLSGGGARRAVGAEPVAAAAVEPRSALAGQKLGKSFDDEAPPGKFLTGLQLALKFSTRKGLSCVAAVRPSYDGNFGAWSYEGLQYRADEETLVHVEARPGYAVGAIEAHAEKSLYGLRVIFMRREGDRLNTRDRYPSRWIGGRSTKGEIRLGGDGRPPVGVFGNGDQHVEGLGLTFVRRNDLPEQPIPVRPFQEIAEIVERAGGRIVRDDARPGRPIVEVDFSETTSLTDVELEAIAGATELKVFKLHVAASPDVVDGWRHLSRMKNLESFIADGNSDVNDGVVAHLADLPKLTTVNVDSSGVTDLGVASLAKIPNLEELVLSGRRVTDACADSLARMTKLRRLKLNGTGITDAGTTGLTGMSKLRELALYSAAMGEPTVERAAGLAELESLELGGLHFNSGLRHLAKLGKLRRLQLYGSSFNDEGAVALRDLKGLRELFVRSAVITDDGLAAVEAMPHLESISVVQMPIVCDFLRYVPDSAPLSKVFLYLTSVDDRGLEHLKRFKSLKSIEVTGPRISSTGVESLRGLTGLTSAIFRHTRIDDRALDVIAGWKDLETLMLQKSDVTAAGLKRLDGLNKLTTLHVSETPIGDDGLASIAARTSVRTLDLHGTSITDAGVRQLVTMPELRVLSLASTRVGDEGAAVLTTAPKLESLDLSATAVTDKAVEHLVGAKSLHTLLFNATLITGNCLPSLAAMPSLRHVYFVQSKMDYVKMKRWHQPLRKLEVHYFGRSPEPDAREKPR
jgi:internalin A